MGRPRAFMCCLLLMACDSTPKNVPKAPPPPPLPVLSARPSEPVERAPSADAPAREAKAETPKAAQTSRGAKQASAERSGQARGSAREQNEAAKVAAPAPAPGATAPTKAAPGKVNVPATAHVKIELPAGLKADLDKDPRMQPWVNQVVATLDRCYAEERKKNAAMAGTIQVLVTMHANERPDADIKQLPPVLSPLVACATGGLMRTKMPLFTGKENARYDVRLRFSP